MKTSNRKKPRSLLLQSVTEYDTTAVISNDFMFWLPVLAMHLPFVEAIANYQGVAADQALKNVEFALKSIAELKSEEFEFLDVLPGMRGTPAELERVDRHLRKLFTAKLDSDSPARWIVLRLFDPNFTGDATPSEALLGAARDALAKPYDKAAAQRDMLATRWPGPGGEIPAEYSTHPKFSSRWWNLHQVLAWVAVRTREVVDMAGPKPGSQVFTEIDNIDRPRLGAHKAQAEIRDALSKGLLIGFRLVNGKPFPASTREWGAILFILSGPDSQDEWWLGYRFLRDDVLELWPAPLALDVPEDAASSATTTGKVAASTTKKTASRKNLKITGIARIQETLDALYSEGIDPRTMNRKNLHSQILERVGKNREYGVSIRTLHRALAIWAPPSKPAK